MCCSVCVLFIGGGGVSACLHGPRPAGGGCSHMSPTRLLPAVPQAPTQCQLVTVNSSGGEEGGQGASLTHEPGLPPHPHPRSQPAIYRGTFTMGWEGSLTPAAAKNSSTSSLCCFSLCQEKDPLGQGRGLHLPFLGLGGGRARPEMKWGDFVSTPAARVPSSAAAGAKESHCHGGSQPCPPPH